MQINQVRQPLNIFAAVGKPDAIASDKHGFDPIEKESTGGNPVTISQAGRNLLDSSLILPTEENAKRLAAEAARELSALLSDVGIDANSAISLTSEPNDGWRIKVQGNRSDLRDIENLINQRPELAKKIHDMAAIGSHVYGMQDSLKFNAEYAAAHTKSELDAAIAKYAYQLNGQQRSAEITVVFDGAGIQLNADGKAWLRPVA